MAAHNGETMIRRKPAAIVREFEGRGATLSIAPRGGKAAASNQGLAAATGEIIFFPDVRQPHEPGCLRHLVANFAGPTVGAVTGALRLLRGDFGEQADMGLYWRYEVWARARHAEIDSPFTAAILVFLAAAFALPSSWFRTSVPIGEAALPLPALSNGFVSSSFPLKRPTSPARTLLVMNAAALVSVAVFFVPAARLWTQTRVQRGP